MIATSITEGVIGARFAAGGPRLLLESLSSTPWHADEPFVANTSTMTSRAVMRPIEPGNSAVCVHCGAPVKFVARAQLKQVIANVYENGAWNRVEHFHADCYGEAGLPYGEADTSGLRN